MYTTEGTDPLLFLFQILPIWCIFRRKGMRLMINYSELINSKFIVCKPDTPFFCEKHALFIHIGGPAIHQYDDCIADEMGEIGILVSQKEDYTIFSFQLSERGIQNNGIQYVGDRIKTIYNLLLQVVPVKYEPDFEVVFPELASFSNSR